MSAFHSAFTRPGPIDQMFGPLKYKYLFEIIRNNKCRRIMEIGTWNGEHALQMIEEAKKNFAPNEVEYYGFDLFELFELSDSKTALGEPTKVHLP